MSNELNELLTKAKDLLKDEMTNISYETWIKSLEIRDFTDDKIILIASSPFQKDAVETRYYDLVTNTFKFITNKDCKIIVEYKDPDSEEEDVKLEEKSFNDNEIGVSNNSLNPKYTFDTFVVGNNNRFAHAASLAVAEAPGTSYNPLFLYSGPGLGKTHLMHSIARYILENHPEYSVMYTTSENFMNNVVDAIRTNRKTQDTAATSNLRKNYRNVDVLLIDDIQFIIGKDSTQIEFFNTFEALYQSGKQLVISSDKPPSQMEHLDMRYRSRFTSGMTIDIQPPDYEMSMAILRNKQENSDIQLNEEILDYIATNIKSNIRILEGAYNKILLFARFTKPKDNKIDLNMAKEALKDFISPNENMVITADYIIDIVADHFNLDKEAILSEKRTKTVSIPRQICMYLCNELTNLTLTEIAVKLKRSNHSTVIHGVHKIEQDILVDKELEETINVLKKKLNS